MEERWLMTGDVGRELRLSPAGVRFLVLTGKLPVAGQTACGFRLFRRIDVVRLRDQRLQVEGKRRDL